MRISDWSSDVCSSDLRLSAGRRLEDRHDGRARPLDRRARGDEDLGLPGLGDDPGELQPRRRAALAFAVRVATLGRADALHALDAVRRAFAPGSASPPRRMVAAPYLAGREGPCEIG